MVAVATALAAALLGALLAALVIPTDRTAEVRLVVGDQTLSAQSVPGYSEATVTLAETYARFVDDTSLGNRLPAGVSHVQATVIPQNPVIRIRATAKTEREALAGASAAAAALSRSVAAVTNGDVAGARRTFLARQSDAERAQLQADEAEKAAGADPTAAAKTRLRASAADARLAGLEADAAATVLQNRLAANAGRSTSVSVIQKPQPVTGSRQPLALGALVGLGVAVLAWTAVSIRRQTRSRAAEQS